MVKNMTTFYSKIDKAILNFLQDEIPLNSNPYEMLAKCLGISEDTVSERIIYLKNKGVIRRLGGILYHQKAGYSSNALTGWKAVPIGDETEIDALDRVGKALSSADFVSHCYAREIPKPWKYPIFAMVHANSNDELESHINQLKELAETDDVCILKTKKEWKKVSMKYL